MYYFSFKASIIISHWREQTVSVLIKKVVFDPWKKSNWLTADIMSVNYINYFICKVLNVLVVIEKYICAFNEVLSNVLNDRARRECVWVRPLLDFLTYTVAKCSSAAWAQLIDECVMLSCLWIECQTESFVTEVHT